VPSKVDPACTAAFDRWWMKAAARNPEYRFAGARELADALGRALGTIETPVDVRDTLRAVGCDAKPPASRHGVRTRFVAAALVVAIAPLVATLARGGIERSTVASARSTNVAAAVPDRAPPPTALSAETVALPERVEASSTPAFAVAAAKKESPDWRGGARTVSPQSKAPAPRPSPTEPPAASDDVDFGI
jgi:hypothetical protein